MKYIKKSPIVEAIQFTKSPDSILEVSKFLHGVTISSTHSNNPIIKVPTGNGTFSSALPGDYIIKHSSGNYEVMDEDEFKIRYMEYSCESEKNQY